MASHLKKTGVKQAGGHSYTESEKIAYVDFINSSLGGTDVEGLPVSEEGEAVFKSISNGVIIPTLIHHAFPEDIDISKVVVAPKNKFEANQNHDLAIAAAKALGCSVVNIGGADLYEGTPHLVMGMLWQVIKKTLMTQVFQNSDLSRLAEGDEVIENAPPEQLLLRWFNYHLKNAGHHRQATNFTTDLQDGELYATLMSQIAPDKISDVDLEVCYRLKDPMQRAEIIMEWAERLGCKKFVNANVIVEGNPRLNLAFTATLFNAYPSLGPTAEELANKKASQLEDQLLDLESLLDDTKLDLEGVKTDLDTEKKEKFETQEKLSDATLKLAEALDQVVNLNKEKIDALETVKQKDDELKTIEGQLEQALEEKDDLFAQLEAEINTKLDFENKLDGATKEVEELKQKQKKDEMEWLSKLEEEMDAKEQLSTELETTKQELEETRTKGQQEVEDLFKKLEEEITEKEQLNSELEATRQAVEEAKKDKEKTESAWEEQLEQTLMEMEEARAAADDTEKDLRKQLSDEKKTNEDLSCKLADTEKALEQTIQETDEEKLALLKRIEELEKQLKEAREELVDKQGKWAKEREELLALADADKRKALEDAERDKDQALDKVRMLLAGSQREGVMQLHSKNLAGLTTWKKRFFVLREGYLCFYKDEKAAAKQKPLGMIDCETTRLYELPEEDVKKPNCFQIDSGQSQFNVQCNSASDMREWMTEIRVAKKKKLGVKVVSEETSEQRKKREAASSRKN